MIKSFGFYGFFITILAFTGIATVKKKQREIIKIPAEGFAIVKWSDTTLKNIPFKIEYKGNYDSQEYTPQPTFIFKP